VRNRRFQERQIAHALVANYYDPRIDALESEIASTPAGDRVMLRERLQKLQTERLYYMLVNDPGAGYAEYRRLSDQANRHRWVGFSMRMLDEFLRYYNDASQAVRKAFLDAGLPHERIVRESAELWAERFYWWGQNDRVVDFYEAVKQHRSELHIADSHMATLGNICARWTGACALLRGYDPEVIEEACDILDRLPELGECSAEQSLARARLGSALGYQNRLGGRLGRAARHYRDAVAAFRKSEDYPDELAVLLHSLAFVYAMRGRMDVARPMAHEALRINRSIDSEYGVGLTLSTLSKIARMRGNYSKAIQYAEEALDVFRDLEYQHGIILAYLGIVQATREWARHEVDKNRGLEPEEHILDPIHQRLEEARKNLDRALNEAVDGSLGADILVLQIERGKLFREMGRVASLSEERSKCLDLFREGESALKTVLTKAKLSKLEKADILRSLADICFLSEDPENAEKQLTEIEELIGEEFLIKPGETYPTDSLPSEFFLPLGEVEALRGEMSFREGNFSDGLRNLFLAHCYFLRFSPNSMEKDDITETLVYYLNRLPFDQMQSLIGETQAWAAQVETGVDGITFFAGLEGLFGV
jgi:tetratricopeptide (TPR) repeat protein